ncbi:flavin reductase family protein [Kribbella shirazensis]|nr:flavin reductase family protein [Kribbella shirazensis]
MIPVPIGDLDPAARFAMVSWTLAPRPIAWVTSLSPDGTRNLAPFSFFTVASTDPLVLMIAVEPRDDGGRKDTLANVVATGEFVVHIAPEHLVAEVARSAEDTDPSFDELADLALATADAEVVRPPVIDGCLAAFECTLLETRQPGRETLVFGTVVAAHAADHLLAPDGRIRSAAVRPLGRIGSVFLTSRQIDSRGARRPVAHSRP